MERRVVGPGASLVVGKEGDPRLDWMGCDWQMNSKAALRIPKLVVFSRIRFVGQHHQ